MTVTITLTDDQAAGIAALIELAERGREDFTHQAEHGDYSPEDLAVAQAQWKATEATAAALDAQQVSGTTHPIIAAVENWLPYAARMDTDNIWEHFTCTEVDATADIAHAAGREDIATMILELHAQGDETEDLHHQSSE